LCHQWLNEGLPDDAAALKRLGGKGVTPALLVKFGLCEDGQRRNKRLETVRQEQRERIAKSRDKIAKMNAARASTREPSRASTRDSTTPILTDILTASSPLTTHHSPISPNGDIPPNPQGDGEVLKLEVIEAVKPKTWIPSTEQATVGSWFNRRGSMPWSEKELAVWRKLKPSADDLETLERYYLAAMAADKDYRRRDLLTLLNNWTGELDRARKFQPKQSGTAIYDSFTQSHGGRDLQSTLQRHPIQIVFEL
jgi:hypothetical protein